MSRNLIGKKKNRTSSHKQEVWGAGSWSGAASWLFKMTVHVLDPLCLSSCLHS